MASAGGSPSLSLSLSLWQYGPLKPPATVDRKPGVLIGYALKQAMHPSSVSQMVEPGDLPPGTRRPPASFGPAAGESRR